MKNVNLNIKEIREYVLKSILNGFLKINYKHA